MQRLLSIMRCEFANIRVGREKNARSQDRAAAIEASFPPDRRSFIIPKPE